MAIRLKWNGTNNKHASKELWAALTWSERFQGRLKERHMVERKFGEARSGDGPKRCRCVGLVKCFPQIILITWRRI